MNAEAPPWSERMRRFAEHECRGLSPLYERIGLEFSQDEELLQWLTECAGPRMNANLPFAAVHYMLLGGAGSEALRAFYPSLGGNQTPDTGDPYPPFREFVLAHAEPLAQLLATRSTQTNEAGRTTYLYPALVLAAQQASRPLALIEVGAAAGLNLFAERYGHSYGNGRVGGTPGATLQLTTDLQSGEPPLHPPPSIVSRVGIDLNPVLPTDADAVRWLQGCVWPEHLDRFTTLRTALDYVAAYASEFELIQANALDALPNVVRALPADVLPVVINTNVLPYFSGDERTRYGEQLAELASERDLAWLAIEVPPFLRAAGFQGSFAGLDTGPTALPLIMSTTFGGQREDRVLAVTGPHGRWMRWL